ncbi:hypothetical protein IFM89_008316 [Coptis chinensis]|uniref:Phytocyanin domain-containing protein n=1 Tax=Coptis chinensis TaxID=261450 RepID=A0A835IA84_9MAGN|nr:hypothetical protein IFM89_008316 [Coptis chinensis]
MAACSMNRLVGFLFVAISLLHCTSAQTTHIVGDASGWAVPLADPTFYSSWASRQTFRVNDTLVFNFASARHDVATVTRTAYDACDASSPIGPVPTTSPVTVTLTAQGSQYYFCSIQGHCAAGQKLSINVLSATASPPTTTPTSPPPTATPTPTSPPPTTTPTSPPPTATPTPTSPPPTTTPTSPPPTTTPTSPPSPPPTATPTSPPPTTAPTSPPPPPTTTPTSSPPPPSSAPGVVVAGFSVTILSIAVALLL